MAGAINDFRGIGSPEIGRHDVKVLLGIFRRDGVIRGLEPMENTEFAVADIQVRRTKLGAAPVDIVAAGFQAKKRQAIDLTPARMGFEQVRITAFPVPPDDLGQDRPGNGRAKRISEGARHACA